MPRHNGIIWIRFTQGIMKETAIAFAEQHGFKLEHIIESPRSWFEYPVLGLRNVSFVDDELRKASLIRFSPPNIIESIAIGGGCCELHTPPPV